MIADRPALLRALTGPSTGHHSHPIPTPGCAACALVVITRATPYKATAPAREAPRPPKSLANEGIT